MSGTLSRAELERQIREKQDELAKLQEQYNRQTDKQGFWSNLWSWVQKIAPKIKEVIQHAVDIAQGLATLQRIIQEMRR
jgi:small-conductance mechanosensitive channel